MPATPRDQHRDKLLIEAIIAALRKLGRETKAAALEVLAATDT